MNCFSHFPPSEPHWSPIGAALEPHWSPIGEQENCVKSAERLKALGNIHLECGYVTPDSVVRTLRAVLESGEEPSVGPKTRYNAPPL